MRAVVRFLSEVALTLGLVGLLFCAYLLWGTGVYTNEQQQVLQHEFQQQPPGKLGKLRLGGAMAILRIPRLGRKYQYAVVEGVGANELRKGPGHYPGTALPGRIGNFVLSGHRTTYAAPFNRIDELKRGDELIVDTREARYVYRVTGKRVVLPTEVDVVAAVPDNPRVVPVQAMITLSTCHPEYSARQRLIVFGVLAEKQERKV